MVDDAHITHGAGFADVQFLLTIQQLHVDLLPGLHITRQTHNFLLGLRHLADFAVQLFLLIFQRLAFFQQRTVGWVIFLEQLGHFRFTEGQLVQLALDADGRVERRLGFQRHIHRVILATIAVELIFSLVQLSAHFRQLVLKELQALFGFFRFTLNVLIEIVVDNLVQDKADLFWIFTVIGQAQHASVFAHIGHGQVAADQFDRLQVAEFGHGETGAFIRFNIANQHGDITVLLKLTHFTFKQLITIFADGVAVRAINFNGQLTLFPQGRHFHARNGDLRRFVAHHARQTFTNQREEVFLHQHVEAKVLNRFAQHHTRGHDFHFSRRGRL